MPGNDHTLVRWFAALAVLALVPVSWWLTRSPWQPDIGGLYSFNRALFNVGVTIAGIALVYLLLGRQSTRHKILVLLSQAVAFGVLLLLVEIPALFFGFDYQKLFDTTQDVTELDVATRTNKPDPVLLHLHWPNSSFSGEVTGNLVDLGIPQPVRYKADVRYDRNGFRNDRPFDRADIAVIGDSFVEAALVAREDTLVAQLEAQLQVPTVNLGQIAYGFRQELEVLRRFAIPLSPRLVVWVIFGGNDLRDVESYERGLQRFGKPLPAPTLEQRLFTRAALVTGGRMLVSLARNASGTPTELALDHSAIFTRRDGVADRVYFGGTEEPWTPHQWEVAVGTLREAHRLSVAQGAEFLVVYVPRKFRVYREFLAISPGTGIAAWTINDLPQALGDWCAQNGMSFVDTTPRLREVAARGEHPYFVDDVHWNALGHATAAAVVIDFLRSARMFPFASDKDLERRADVAPAVRQSTAQEREILGTGSGVSR